jgi:hypothetical protein
MTLLNDAVDTVTPFITETGKDFVSVWKMYPNVLIWCAIAFLIAVFV